MIRTCWSVLALLALLAGPAQADIVTLADGRVLEGSVTVSGTTVIIRHRLGEVRVDRSQIVKVEETDDVWDQLDRLRAELAQGTADERYRFAVFCRENGFADDARKAFLSVLRVDTDHPGARAALGYVKDDGRWITVEDKNRALGLVQHEGEWMTPEARAARVEQTRQAAEARRAERDAEQARARARREAEREATAQARRERAELYAQELARARARERALDSYERPNGIYSGYNVLNPWGGVRVFNGGWGWGGGLYRPPCPVVVPRGGVSYGFGSQARGSHHGGRWQLNWRYGF